MKKIIITVMVLALALSCVIGVTACKKVDTSKVITVGYTIYEPMDYEDTDGTLIGFDADLARAVFEDMGYTVVFKEIKWESKYVDLNAGTIDCIWNGFTSSGADEDEKGNSVNRRDMVDFSYDYMKNYQAVVVKGTEKAAYTSLDTSFAGKIGYVEAGSAGAEYAENAVGATVQEAETQMQAIQQVLTGAADFAVVDYLLANSIIGKGDFASLAFVSDLNSDEEYYAIGFKKGSELTKKVNETLEKLAANGTIAKIAAKYGLDNAVITDFSSQK